MMFSQNFDPKHTSKLFGHNESFLFFKNLILNKKLPNVILLSGHKGIGKFTIINHLLHYYFDNKNYNVKENTFSTKSLFHNQFLRNLHPNIFHLNGSDFKNVKIEDIRELKQKLLKTAMNNDKRFIILDDVETFNTNSLNALLKIIEEPNKNNYFVLINSKTKPLLETIKSRCLEKNIILNSEKINQIILSLGNYFNQKNILDKIISNSTPGNILKFNYFFDEKKINFDEGFSYNINIILDFYKKEKDNFYKDIIFFYVDYYFKKNMSKLNNNTLNYLETRSFVIKNINDFFLYNLNQNTLINSIESKSL